MNTRALIEALNAHFEDGCEAASTAPRLRRQVNPEELFKAVAKHLEAEAYEAEQATQTRQFTAQERIAFRCGFFRGLVTDVHRADHAMWERAAAGIGKPSVARS